MYPKEFGKEDSDELEVDTIYLEIVHFTRGKWRTLGYLSRILCYLREHIELCEDPDYQKLYDECIYYLLLEVKLNNLWTRYSQQEQKDYLEFVADLENKSVIFDKLPKSEVEAYLNYRKNRWNQMK
ncbi:MAG: hypothetical protein IJW49_10445 [Clostridia bacterium]|nr:hypothetical protein [Clostridia bacterium]